MIFLNIWRYNTRGYNKDPAVQVHPKLLFGPGEYLTPEFQSKHNISHVINCAQEEYSPSWFKYLNQEKYFCLDAIDSFDVKILSWYSKFKEIVDKFLESEECTNIYIHCQAGINRSGFLTLMYVCSELNYPLKKTELQMVRKRPCSLTNSSFRKEIYQVLNTK